MLKVLARSKFCKIFTMLIIICSIDQDVVPILLRFNGVCKNVQTHTHARAHAHTHTILCTDKIYTTPIDKHTVG